MIELSDNRLLPIDEILTPEQVAERLQVNVSWVYEQTRKRNTIRGNTDTLPYRKMGKYLRFCWREIVAWLDRQNPHPINTRK